jgi:dTDP-glucose 4,6-dehydratase
LTKRVLLSGAGGFIGHHVLEHVMATTDWNILATDSFRHKGNTDRIAEVLDGHQEWRRRVRVITHDLAAPFTAAATAGMGEVDYLIAMASESHVDRSITDPVTFGRNNVDVALNTLELARALAPQVIILVSTDEVYGPVDAGSTGHPEWACILPSNPYSASKAAQEAFAISYWRTYGLPVIITNTMNVVGQRQSPEKYLPMLIRKISRGETVHIHGREGDVGSRHYLHARNAADAWLHILRELPQQGFPAADRPDRYNIAGPEPVSNLDLAREVAEIIGRPLRYELVDFHSARPGHDPHYGLDPSKLAATGWKPPVDFRESLEHTVRWSLAHPVWLADD